MKPGDRVEWEAGGQIIRGIVESMAGGKAIVAADTAGSKPLGSIVRAQFNSDDPRFMVLADGPSAEYSVILVAPNRISGNPWNPPDRDSQDLDGLVADVIKNGLISPITVRELDDGYEVVAGSRRRMACIRAGMTAIPCYNLGKVTREVAYMTTIRENALRKNLSVAETLEAVARMSFELRMTSAEIGAAFGFQASWADHTLRFLGMPDEVIKLIGHESQVLTRKHLFELLRLWRVPATQVAVARRAVAENLTFEQLKRVVNQALASGDITARAPRTKGAQNRRVGGVFEHTSRSIATLFVEWHERGLYPVGELTLKIAQACQALGWGPDELLNHLEMKANGRK